MLGSPAVPPCSPGALVVAVAVTGGRGLWGGSPGSGSLLLCLPVALSLYCRASALEQRLWPAGVSVRGSRAVPPAVRAGLAQGGVRCHLQRSHGASGGFREPAGGGSGSLPGVRVWGFSSQGHRETLF